MNKNSNGQSVVEIIVAVSLMVIIAGSAVVAVLGSFSTSRLAEEETQATTIASEGMEAVQSMRNQSWSNLSDGDHGLTDASGVWVFSGTSDTDASGRFTRVINISPVLRDISGDIVTSFGVSDPDTKSVTSTVTWNFTIVRQNEVSLQAYITNWQEALDPFSAEPPEIATCNDLCTNVGHTTGVCRKSVAECTSAGETNEVQGDQFCTTQPNDTCCCLP